MDLITIAIDRVKYEIPPEVLKYTFSPSRYDPTREGMVRDYNTGVSMETVIRRQVVDARVLTDINLCSGVELYIPLSLCQARQIDPWTVEYIIPTDLTNGRYITTPYSISFGMGLAMGHVGGLAEDRSQVLEATQAMVQSNVSWTLVQTAQIDLVADNVIIVTNMPRMPGIAYLRALVSHEPNLSNIPNHYADVFSELVVLATKAHIYTRTIIQLDEGAIRGGASLGRIREVIDSYADANQLYKEHLTERWRKAGVMANTTQHQRLLRYVVGARR